MALVSSAAMTKSPPLYAEGQVWEYRTRPQDAGSLLKIQKIDRDPAFRKSGPVYHISIVGLTFPGLPLGGVLQHAPFTKDALDSSVTKLSVSKATFPDATASIAEWRQAQGGVFTISVAETVGLIEQTFRKQPPP